MCAIEKGSIGVQSTFPKDKTWFGQDILTAVRLQATLSNITGHTLHGGDDTITHPKILNLVIFE